MDRSSIVLNPIFDKLSNFGDFSPFYPIGVFILIMSFWQMIADGQVFNRNDPIFDIAQLLGRKKTTKVNFVSIPIP